MLFAILSALTTYELSKLRFIGAIRASSIVGIIIYTLGFNFESLDSSILFGATFVGMCSSHRINRLELVLSTIIYIFVLGYLKNHFHGYGGILGMSSFIAVVSIFTLTSFHKKLKNSRRK